MRVLLRSTDTGLLYAGTQKWTEDSAEAIGFRQPGEALDRVEAESLDAVELLMHFESPGVDVPLTIFSAGARA
jgi:hypothetical protein